MSLPRRDMRFEYLTREKIVISYTGPDTTQRQWEQYLELMRSVIDVPGLRFLVFVEGPPPSLDIQKRIGQFVRRDSRVALLSSSVAMRFVVSMFSLVNPTIRYFGESQLSAALAHLGCSDSDARAVDEALPRVQFGAEDE